MTNKPKHIVIETPRGQVVYLSNGKAALVWNPRFTPKWTRRYSAVQKFVDSEVLLRCEPYTPLLTSVLIKTGILGTSVGSGLVQWIAPYARRRYYMRKRIGSPTGALRGSFWFERMKATQGKNIISGAKKLARQSK